MPSQTAIGTNGSCLDCVLLTDSLRNRGSVVHDVLPPWTDRRTSPCFAQTPADFDLCLRTFSYLRRRHQSDRVHPWRPEHHSNLLSTLPSLVPTSHPANPARHRSVPFGTAISANSQQNAPLIPTNVLIWSRTCQCS
ncbi:hypothetical protein VTN49DRAFT_1600 [Thermomyces lanuginosus]|uniref:uncharacterized protein n=1 Tax=Thermomyces lanuginosus TaxID=5541 RepID=UPI003743A877